MKRLWLIAAAFVAAMGAVTGAADAAKEGGLWSVYDNSLRAAKYIGLTHRLTAQIPVWKGFGPARVEARQQAPRGRS